MSDAEVLMAALLKLNMDTDLKRVMHIYIRHLSNVDKKWIRAIKSVEWDLRVAVQPPIFTMKFIFRVALMTQVSF